MGRVWVGLLEGLLYGPKDMSVDKRIRVVLVSLKGFKGFGLGFHLKPTRWTWPARRLKSPTFKSSSPMLASEDQLGASEAEPPAPMRSTGFGSSPVSFSAFPLAVDLPVMFNGGLLSPEDDVGAGSLSVDW